LIVTTGGIDPGLAMQAHHVFPQRFRQKLALQGINIDDPKYLTWWTTEGAKSHQRMAKSYNEAWAKFMEAYPDASNAQILEKGRELTKAYEIRVNY
jgi:hypothetical protein